MSGSIAGTDGETVVSHSNFDGRLSASPVIITECPTRMRMDRSMRAAKAALARLKSFSLPIWQEGLASLTAPTTRSKMHARSGLVFSTP
jgi:hypothetical protein